MIALDEEQNTPDEAQERTWTQFLIETVRFILIALVIILPFRLFVAQPFVVNGASMTPTFESGEYLIVDQLTYAFEEPQRGSVVIFKYPKNPDKFFIKRIIGLPSEKIVINEGEVTIYNDASPEGITLTEPYVTHHSHHTSTTTLGAHEYFVLGDNRSGSSDSRTWGPLKDTFIVGRPLIRLLPPSTIGLFPGTHTY